MTNSPGESKPDYHAPIDGKGRKTPLVPAARSAHSLLTWAGIIALLGWAVAGTVGMSSDTEEVGQIFGAFAFAGLCLQIAIPCIVGAVVVAGLGKRE